MLLPGEHRVGNGILRYVLVAAVALAIACGASEYRTPLSNGCSIARVHGTGRFVTGPGGIGYLVPPEIVDFRVREPFLIGRLAPPDPSSHYSGNHAGYFFADMRDGSSTLGLTEAQWRDLLVENGIPRDAYVAGIPSRYKTTPVKQMMGWVATVAVTFGVLVVLLDLLVRRHRRSTAVRTADAERLDQWK